jgi:hypothetical protein
VEERQEKMTQERREKQLGRVARQATAVFADAEITAVLSADDGLIYASFPHLCRALGLDVESQRERVEEHAVLQEGLLPFELVSGTRVVTNWCLRSNLIALWLTLVPVKRLKLGRQQRIAHFQQKAADALDRLFGTGQGTGLPTEAREQALSMPGEASAYAEGLAIARLAEEQDLLHEQLGERMTALELVVDQRLSEAEGRLAALEARLMPREQISEEQAEQISDLIKQVAIALGQKLGGGNYFGTVYGQLYRRFGITSYKKLSQAQYPKAVAWLEQMRDRS